MVEPTRERDKIHLSRDEYEAFASYVEEELEHVHIEVEKYGSRGVSGTLVEHEEETTYFELFQDTSSGKVFRYRTFDISLEEAVSELIPDEDFTEDDK